MNKLSQTVQGLPQIQTRKLFAFLTEDLIGVDDLIVFELHKPVALENN